jgi:hypothetical protein
MGTTIGPHIYEIKPNTAGSIKAGLERVREYAALANAKKVGGRADCKGIVVIYDGKAAQVRTVRRLIAVTLVIASVEPKGSSRPPPERRLRRCRACATFGRRLP